MLRALADARSRLLYGTSDAGPLPSAAPRLPPSHNESGSNGTAAATAAAADALPSRPLPPIFGDVGSMLLREHYLVSASASQTQMVSTATRRK